MICFHSKIAAAFAGCFFLNLQIFAADFELVRSLSGPSGKFTGLTFVFDQTRNRFVYPQDQSLTVFFEWKARPGLHVLSGIWKSPDGRVASISPDVKIESPGTSLSCYWIFNLVPGMANGVWALEVRLDGQPAGSHPFEIAGMTEVRAETPAAPAAKLPTVDEIYRKIGPSLVWIHKLDSTGRRIDSSSGFVFRKNAVATSFQSIDSADKIEVEFGDGRRVAQTELMAWSRMGDWCVLAADTGSLAPVPSGDAEAVAIGERFVVFNVEGNARIIGGVDVGGRRSLGGFGERIQFSPPVSPEAVGGPLLNRAGEAVGILGGALNQGAHNAVQVSSLHPGLWNAIQAENAAVPISAIPAQLPAKGETLRTLANNGTLTAPLIPIEAFLFGGASTVLPKLPGDPIPRDNGEFSVRDPQIWVFSFWAARGKTGKGEVGARIYDPQNQARVTATSKKVNLGRMPERAAFAFSPATLPPGLYRVDITWNGDAVWRTFIRISQ